MNRTNTPKVSLLIAMRNEAGRIGECLESIMRQDYPADGIEVLILDGQSTDSSWKIVEGLIAGRPNFKLISNPGIFQSHGWNLGISQSTGDIIGIVGAHSYLATDYVATAVETLTRTGADMVGGGMNAIGTNRIASVISLATSSPFGVGGARFHYADREENVDTVYMGLCWRSVYERIGGFDEEMIRNQDDELSYRLRKLGGRIICNPKIKSHYYNRASLSSLWKQYFQYGLYKIRVLQKHPLQMRPRQFIPFVFVFALILSLLIAFIPVIRPLSPVVPLLYLLANLFASLSTAATRGWKHIPLLPVVFAILHLSYGLGFLVGLFKFRNRWNDREGKVPHFDVPAR
ncbi:MAG: glycosyltransferase family 2 protein [Chloroflexi bacterium]|nr:glycosyltransferase family 2 protein [Chloroflexota bacterium]